MPDQINFSGNTVLHNAVLKCKSISDIEDMEKTKPQELFRLARTVNDHNQLPYHLLGGNIFLTKDEKSALGLYLLNLATRATLLPLDEPIDEVFIGQKYQIHSINTTLMQQLHYGCMAVNAVRQMITVSSTHPQIVNWIPYEMRIKLNNMHEAIRASNYPKKRKLFINDAYQNFTDSHINNTLTIRFTLSNNAQVELYNDQINLIKTMKIANCGEYASLVYDYLLTLHKKESFDWPIELCSLTNGDHMFVKLGCDPDSVIIDAWAGKVYPVCDCYEELCAYTSIEHEHQGIRYFKSVLIPFNPLVHSIRSSTDDRFPHTISYRTMEIHPLLAPVYCLFIDTPNEKVLFYLINEAFTMAIKDKVITEQEIGQLKNIKAVLTADFRNCWGYQCISEKLLTFSELDNLEPHVAKKLTTRRGLHCLQQAHKTCAGLLDLHAIYNNLMKEKTPLATCSLFKESSPQEGITLAGNGQNICG
ncbi:MAG: hypothetical protein QM652_11115 [Legionella sp.]|uniref:hypothetical protein n=1 Tax=Legionella sp. TaxID=459 RepID=UPI0039E262E7